MTRRHKHAKVSRAALRITSRPPALPELTDNAAAQIQQLLCDWLLWFSAAYGEQIRRCNEPWAVPPREPPPGHRIGAIVESGVQRERREFEKAVAV